MNETDPGSCMPCERDTYSTSPFEGCTDSCSVRLCNECPEGATCSGGLDENVENHFQPKNGVWEVEATALPLGGEMLRYRVSQCQEGYKLLREGSSGSYTRDQCQVCEYGKMALGRAEYDPAHEARIQQCFGCETLTGVVCKGGSSMLKTWACMHTRTQSTRARERVHTRGPCGRRQGKRIHIE